MAGGGKAKEERDLAEVKGSLANRFRKMVKAKTSSDTTMVKKITKKANFWHARIKSPNGAKVCRVPDFGKTIAESVHTGAKITMCKYGADWHVQKVMIPIKGVSKEEAVRHACMIVNKINKKCEIL